MAGEKTSWLRDVINMIDEFGIIKMIYGTIVAVLLSMISYIIVNPSIIFEKYDAYAEQRHTESFNYRMENTPVINNIMRQMVLETGAIRSFVIEMHNGKSNSAGLSFNYGTLTYEGLRDSVESIKEDYNDFTLDRFPILNIVYRKGSWIGSIEELRKIDKRLAYRLESNDADFVALQMLYGVKTEIGFIGVTYSKNDKLPTEREIQNYLHSYAPKIAPLLDGEKAKEK